MNIHFHLSPDIHPDAFRALLRVIKEEGIAPATAPAPAPAPAPVKRGRPPGSALAAALAAQSQDAEIEAPAPTGINAEDIGTDTGDGW